MRHHDPLFHPLRENPAHDRTVAVNETREFRDGDRFGKALGERGDILGNVNDVGVQISDCLNLGTIVSLNNREYLGGIVGKGDTNHCTIRINRCVSVVDPTSASRKVGGIISFGNKPIDDDEFLDCFTAGERYAVCKEGNEAIGDSIRTGKTTLRELIGADVPEAVKTSTWTSTM